VFFALNPMARSVAGHECVREDASSARCESVPGWVARPEIEGNRIIARWRGKQPEVNRQSVGWRTCFGGVTRRACSWMAKPGTTDGAEATDKATGGRITWLRSECRDGEAA